MIKKIKKFIWLSGVFLLRIIISPNEMKIPFFKRIYFNSKGFTANQVGLYNLNKQNKDEYLTEFDWYKSRFINKPYDYLLNDKILCVNLIKSYIKTPTTLYIKKEDQNFDENKVLEIIKKEKSTYFKPISIGKGIGVFRLDYKDNKYYKDFKEISKEELLKIFKTKNNYFLSSCIQQSEYINNIYNKTSNTIRLITVKTKGSVKVLYAVQRIGTKETIPVDNGSRGGLVSKIDLNTGKLSSARSIHNTNEYKYHPDSNIIIEGVKVPNWNNIKKELITLMEKLPQFYLIAWDLLITEDGVYVLEANSSSGVNIIQVFGGQRNKELGNFFKERKIIK